MRYVRFEDADTVRIGVVLNGFVIALSDLVPDGLSSINQVVMGGSALQKRIAEAAAVSDATRRPIDQCPLKMPISDFGKLICLGLNYAEHAAEGGHERPDYPSVFMRTATSLTGPGEPMILPTCSEQFDYEAELMVVIGEKGRHLEEANAADIVFGYTAFNDGSIRDYQRRTPQWTPGKNFDKTGALGPCIVTADELSAEARGLGIRTRLNGQVMQEANTDQMIFGVSRTLVLLSEIMTLEPGDLIAMGTPSGVGHARRPPVWMRDGDTVEVEIDGIGTLRNDILAESAT